RGVGYLLNKPLASLGLSGTAVTDRAVAELSASPKLRASLRELWLNNGHLTDASLDDLRKMSDLRVLDIGNNNIASIDQKQLIDYLKGSKLRALSIYHLQIDDAILPALESMPELKELNLRDTLVTDKGLSTFKPAHLRKLNLQRCEKISRDGVNLFKKNNPDCKDIEKDEPISL
ncbi:MAG TPA: leucine-rich repeat domain-containing protein, partial [Chroococcales cyanobacterium]